MRRRPPLPALIAVVSLFAAVGDGDAQGTVDVVLTAPAITFAPPGLADFDSGWIEHPSVAVAVTSRPGARSWALRIRATSPTLGQGKPVSDLQWRTAGSPDWMPMSEIGDMVMQGAGDQDITLYFRMLLSWADDAPGAYSTGLELIVLRI